MEVISKNEILPEDLKLEVQSKNIEKLSYIKKHNLIIKTEVKQLIKRKDNEGGSITAWQLDLDGVPGIVLFEETGLKYEKQMELYVGRQIYVKIIKIIPEPEYVICSRKLALQDLEESLFKKIQAGQIVQGTIHAVGNKFVYVDIGGYVGRISRKDATRSKLPIPLKGLFTVGEKVQVKITNVDYEKKEISLSIVEATPNPWMTANIQKKDVVVGHITKIITTPNGHNVAFAEIMPGLEAIVTVPAKGFALKPGDKIQARVTKFDPQNKKFRVRLIQKLAK